MIRTLIIAGILLLAGCATVHHSKVRVDNVIADAEAQTKVMLKEIPKAKEHNSALVSPRTLENSQLKLVASKDWTSGFFPGQLWYLYALTHKDEWKTEARKFTANIEQEKYNGTTHVWVSKSIAALAMVICRRTTRIIKTSLFNRQRRWLHGLIQQ